MTSEFKFVSLSALDERTSASDSGSSTLLVSGGARCTAVPPHHCEVRVICAGVNADDVAAAKSQQDETTTTTTTTATRQSLAADRVGVALAGVVERVGAHVSAAFRVGAAVCALLPLAQSGAYASHVLVPEELLVPKLRRVSFAVAAASLQSASVAYGAVLLQCQARAGQLALVVNPACVEGVLAVRLLVALKLSCSVLVRGAAERALLTPVLPAAVRYVDDLSDSIAAGERFDHVVELRPTRAPGEPHVESVRVVEALAAHGTWVVCHSRPRELNAALSQPMMRKSARLAFVFEHTWASAATTRGALAAALLDFQKRVAAAANTADTQPDLLSLDDEPPAAAAATADGDALLATDDGALLVPQRPSFAIRPLDVRCFDASEADSALRHARAGMQLQGVAIRFAPDPVAPAAPAFSLL